MLTLQNVLVLVWRIDIMVNPNSWYITMHFDRLNEELISGTYGKQEMQKDNKTDSTDVEQKET